MQTLETKFKPAGAYGRGAAINAVYRDRENRSTFSAREIARVETVRDLVGIVFPSSECYVNFRKKFIAVKISKPSRERLRTTQAQMFEDVMSDYQATKVVTETSIVYRIPKQ